MVAAELERLDGWDDLGRDDRLKLTLTALFHDAGKPATTVTDPATGRTHAPKHALVGSGLARAVLRDAGCPLGFREEVAALVRFHGRPPFLLDKADPAREVIAMSWSLSNRLLADFAVADVRGRTATDSTRSEDDLHLWRLAAEENGCLDTPYAFPNDHARFLFFRGELSSLHYVPREDHRCTVTLMAGLPGAGKDTWLSGNRPGLPVVSLDDIRADLDVDPTGDQGAVIQAARERCRGHLRAGRDFAFNATNTVRQTRQRWVDVFADYGARVEICYLEPPLDTIHRQNGRRREGVPRRVVDRLVERLEPPARTEGHAVALIG